MAEPLFKIKMHGRVYELSNVTLGEFRVMKDQFGLAHVDDFNPMDADHLAGALYLCLTRAGVSPEVAVVQAESLDLRDLVAVPDQAAEPTQTAATAREVAIVNTKPVKYRRITGSPT